MVNRTPQTSTMPKEPPKSELASVVPLRSLLAPQTEGFGRRIYIPILGRHLPVRSWMTSVVMHLLFGILLIRFPFELISGPPPQPQPEKVNTPIYYTVHSQNLSKLLPSILPPGAGSKPGHGIHKDKVPALGSTNFHPKLTIVLTPPHPDNKHQTIIQPNSPPDLRITQDLKLPNILVGNPLALAKPKLDPKASKGTLSRKNDTPNPDAPSVEASTNDPIAAELAPIKDPHLRVPVASGLSQPSRPTRAPASGGGGTSDEAGGASGLLAVSTDPANTAQLSELLPGSRYGAFTVSPAGGQVGSPGGGAGGDPQGGTGGPGTGGNGSVGVGSGANGGGGGGAGGNSGILSIKGGNGGKEGTMLGGDLGYSPENMVYVVAPPPGVRSNTLIVSAGPVGGGGLGVYGALKCGRVYSVFLPMPGKSWILQYCASGVEAPDVAYEQKGSSVSLESTGLVPPHADEKYDFKRVPVTEDLKDKMIVLRGVIGVDGSISNLEVYRGIVPQMDSMALAAFTKWKFKPALHENKPISVDVLIGVPVRIPAAH
jgi:hypothetical protein